MKGSVKYFSVSEANRTLPLVRKIVQDILEAGKKLRQVGRDEKKDISENPQFTALSDQLESLFLELEALGCSYRDWNFDLGLVDFPALIEDEEVLLCWKSDEPEIKYFHTLDQGFAGRQLIPAKYLIADLD